MKIEIFVRRVSEMLGIPTPPISLSMGDSRPTTLGYFDGIVLHLRRLSVDLDMLFTCAHELRHFWQMQERPDLLEGYRRINECADQNDYNLQAAEIDANAFALWLMLSGFGITPLFSGLSDDVKKIIRARADEIAREMENIL